MILCMIGERDFIGNRYIFLLKHSILNFRAIKKNRKDEIIFFQKFVKLSVKTITLSNLRRILNDENLSSSTRNILFFITIKNTR
jgi:hypothetical protein